MRLLGRNSGLLFKGRGNHDDTTRHVTRTYWLAIATVAVLTVFSQVVVNLVVKQEELDQQVVHLASAQKGTALQISKDLFALAALRDKPDRIRIGQIMESLDVLKGVHNQLRMVERTMIREGRNYGNVLKLLESSETMYRSVIVSARDILNVKSKEVNPFELQSAYDRLDRLDVGFQSSLDSVIQQIRVEANSRTELVQRLRLIYIYVILILLAAEAYYVFRPAIRKVRYKVEALQRTQGELQAQQDVIQKQNSKLQSDNLLIQETAENLEAANQRIEAAARRFEELFQGLPVACFGYDPSGAIFEWNRACEELFDGGVADFFMQNMFTLLAPNREDDKLREVVERVFTGESTHLMEWPRVSANGNVRYLLCSTFPIHGQNNNVSGGIFSCVEITAQKEYERRIEEQLDRINEYSAEIEQRRWELEEANARLESLASTDGLTGLNNHRSFQEALRRELKRSRREGTSLSLIMLDVDHFKAYNDSFGHPAGDAVLQDVAKLLVECARETDLVARYGGEEFVVVLPCTGMVGAEHVAERIRSAIEKYRWPKRSVTVSLGVAVLNENIDTAAELLQRADEALYQSKRQGRNQVTCAVGTESSEAA